MISSAFCNTHSQGVKHFKDIQYSQHLTYGEMFLQASCRKGGGGAKRQNHTVQWRLAMECHAERPHLMPTASCRMSGR